MIQDDRCTGRNVLALFGKLKKHSVHVMILYTNGTEIPYT